MLSEQRRRTYLTVETAVRSILHKMEREPGYRPRGFNDGEAGLEQARECLQDVRELTRDLQAEGQA